MHAAFETFSYIRFCKSEYDSVPESYTKRKSNQGKDERTPLFLFRCYLLLHLIASLEYLVPALNGRLGKLLALAQFFNYAYVTVFPLVTLERTINRLSFFYVDDDHVRTVKLRAEILCPFGEKNNQIKTIICSR